MTYNHSITLIDQYVLTVLVRVNVILVFRMILYILQCLYFSCMIDLFYGTNILKMISRVGMNECVFTGS